MSIELRLSDVEPPDPEPKRTIYRDIANLPDPTKLGITIRYFNYDDVGLYMQITGSGTGYTFGTTNLGLLASGANAYRHLDEWASKAKPSPGDLPGGEMQENITLTLKGYTDSGYTNLKWTFERIVTVYWINSADAAFTVDELDNFDDGTVQGWAAANETGNDGGYPAVGVVTDYVLSASYSLRITQQAYNAVGNKEVRGRLYKSFTTQNKPKVFAIFDIRLADGDSANTWKKYIASRRDGTTLIFLGRPFDAVASSYVPLNRWIRIVMPLPGNTTLTVQIAFDWLHPILAATYSTYVRMDDFKIVSKS